MCLLRNLTIKASTFAIVRIDFSREGAESRRRHNILNSSLRAIVQKSFDHESDESHEQESCEITTKKPSVSVYRDENLNVEVWVHGLGTLKYLFVRKRLFSVIVAQMISSCYLSRRPRSATRSRGRVSPKSRKLSNH